MQKIGIVMSSFNRVELTNATLSSIISQNDEDYHIVVVDDEPNGFEYSHENVTVIKSIKGKQKWCTSVVQLNQGLQECIDMQCDIIIMQNSESLHVGSILKYIRENLNEEDYFSFACLSQPKSDEITAAYIQELAKCGVPANGSDVGWYNHSHFYPRFLDFCVATSTKNWKKLNGHDERFANKIWYNDDNLVRRARLAGLNMQIIDNPYVLHQWHSRSYQDLTHINESHDLFHLTIAENDYKAKHIYTKDLC